MLKVLKTNGTTATNAVKEFERYDLIRYSLLDPGLGVDSVASTGGVLDLFSAASSLPRSWPLRPAIPYSGQR
jgi:hypothetical protein